MEWKTLKHLNVLPLLGVTMSNDRIAMALEFVVSGNTNQYSQTNSNANRFELVGLCSYC